MGRLYILSRLREYPLLEQDTAGPELLPPKGNEPETVMPASTRGESA